MQINIFIGTYSYSRPLHSVGHQSTAISDQGPHAHVDEHKSGNSCREKYVHSFMLLNRAGS